MEMPNNHMSVATMQVYFSNDTSAAPVDEPLDAVHCNAFDRNILFFEQLFYFSATSIEQIFIDFKLPQSGTLAEDYIKLLIGNI